MPASQGFDVREVVDGLRDAFISRPAGPDGARRHSHRHPGVARRGTNARLPDHPGHRDPAPRWRGSRVPVPSTRRCSCSPTRGSSPGTQDGERKVYSLTEAGRAAAADAGEGGTGRAPLPGWTRLVPPCRRRAPSSRRRRRRSRTTARPSSSSAPRPCSTRRVASCTRMLAED